MTDALPIRLVAGLGNPGREYENTRHNVGFLVIDALAARSGLAMAFSNSWQALWGKAANGCCYVKPMTYMNRSGRTVGAMGKFYKFEPAQTLIIYDDLALPLGRLRIRHEGSAGGHNGMQSVIEHLGTPAVPRLRVGIGAVGGGGMVDYVLGQFKASERAALDDAVDRAAQAVDCACLEGVAAAMNKFNRPPEV